MLKPALKIKGLRFIRTFAAYLDLADANSDRFMVIDAVKNEKTIHDDIIARLEPILRAAQ